MDFEVTYTEAQQSFRREVRAWLEANVPPGITRTPADDADSLKRYQELRAFGRKLWRPRAGSIRARPRPTPAAGSTSIPRSSSKKKSTASGSLPPYYDSGGRLGSATIQVWGTEEQKQAFLPPIYRGDVRTWQLLTEPGAGSDLAGVTTAAIRDGDEYVINGQKIFVGSDHGADRIWMIACTNPGGARHENLSWFMIDANLPGITVQPMELLGTGGEGGTDPVQKNTVFFDSVRVPAFTLVGGENNGWKAASTHLELEHGAGGRIGRHRVWDRLLRYCQETKRDGMPLTEAADTRDLLADIYIKTEVQRLFGLRNFWLTYARRPRSYEGPQLSYYRKMTGLWMTGAILEAVGPAALTTDPTLGLTRGLPRAAAAQRHHRRASRRHCRCPARQHVAPDRDRPRRPRGGRHGALGWISR